MTNYEKVKNMSSEEMAEFLMDWFMDCMSGKALMNVRHYLNSEVGENENYGAEEAEE